MQTYEDGKNTMSIYERKASIKEFNCKLYFVKDERVLTTVYPLLFLGGVTSIFYILVLNICRYTYMFAAFPFCCASFFSDKQR